MRPGGDPREARYNEFASWPSDERSAVVDYLHDWLRESMSTLDLGRFDSILCGAAEITDISLFLDAADRFDKTLVLRYQANFARSNKRKLTNSFWNRTTTNYDKVLRWAYQDMAPPRVIIC